MRLNSNDYIIINPGIYKNAAVKLLPKLDELDGNRITFKNEIHRFSRFAICHYEIHHENGNYTLTYDALQSPITSRQKKTNTAPTLLNNNDITDMLKLFLTDINDPAIRRAEVKLIQTAQFPFIFNPHRDSQFRRLRNITYLATVILSASGITGGNMQLFHSENDKLGPFRVIEELPVAPGVGYIVDERPQRIFHGMKSAYATDQTAHRAALLIRFF
ncbi:MAG: hypothetical protein O3A01_05120 [bacterium]|nr:hypothetical protein [bacterium]